MAKRKRGQPLVSGDATQTPSQPDSKKQKTDGKSLGTPKPIKVKDGSNPLDRAPKVKNQGQKAQPRPEASQTEAQSQVSRSALKRKRQRQKVRKESKNPSASNEPKAKREESKSEALGRTNEKPHLLAPLSQPPPLKSKIKQPKTQTIISTVPPPKAKRQPLDDKSTKGSPAVTSFTQASSELLKEAESKLSKRQRRRQKLKAAKHSESANFGHSKGQSAEAAVQDASVYAPANPFKPSSDVKERDPINASLLQRTTQTNLLPRPTKQWVQDAVSDVEQPLIRDVAQTNLLARPHKEWIQQDELDIPDTGYDLSQAQVPEHQSEAQAPSQHVQTNNGSVASPPQNERKVSSPRPNFQHAAPSSPEQSDSECSSEAETSAKLSVSTKPTQQTTKPVVKTVTSLSFPMTPQPASVPSNQKRASGLSGLRMDTGSFGGSVKPMSALKATSVPSYSSRGDAKAAFARFNNFAHNRNESDSDEGSESSDDSNDSESEREAEVKNAEVQESSAKCDASPTGKSRPHMSSQDMPEEDGKGKFEQERKNEHDGALAQDHVTETSSEENESEVDDEQAAEEGNHDISTQRPEPPLVESSQAPTNESSDHPGIIHESLSNGAAQPGSRMERASDLPLFSDFYTRDPNQPANTNLPNSSSFLGGGLGGDPSGHGQSDDHSAGTKARPFSSQLASGELTSTQDTDDLYRSIEDVSREVFGSTRALPDCKLPQNLMDVITEHPVTESLSNHGLKKTLTGNRTPDKAIPLSYVPRGSSPMVWIVNDIEVGSDRAPDNAIETANEESEQEAERPLLHLLGNSKTRRYSSPLSSVSSLTPSPPPLDDLGRLAHVFEGNKDEHVDEHTSQTIEDGRHAESSEEKKRRMTGTTSKHFSPQKSLPKKEAKEPAPSQEASSPLSSPSPSPPPRRPKRKQTGKTSTFFSPSPTKPLPRPPKGTSTSPVPPITAPHFGLIQEKLAREPFWLLIAVTFLNKTAGRSAAPIFWSLKALYPTPLALSQASEADLVEMIASLGLQNQRAKRLVAIARAWFAGPPVRGVRHRTLHYPAKGDGKGIKKDEILEEDEQSCAGALEIGHIPGCGPYAWDSWRIFCRDVVRGVAEDYNGKGAVEGAEFEPEWKRVLPLDKELRACLRWMWLREGWVWDPVGGGRREATAEEMEDAKRGRMGFGDEGEEKFAREAAGKGNGEDEAGEVAPAKKSRRRSIARRGTDLESEHEEVPVRKRLRRSKHA